MAERLDRAWRVFGTGLSFLAFGVGGVLLRVLVLPPLQWWVREPMRRQRLARRLVQRSFASHVWLMQLLGVMSYEIRNPQRLRRDGLLILANHPTLIDVVLLIAQLPNADCVVKSAVARNPFMRGPVRAAGYVANDDGAGLVEDCIAAVRAGGNLVIFPEGTRTPRDGTFKLQRGAANIAVRGRLDVTPVIISCTPLTLGKGEKWYRVPSRRMHVVIDVLDDLPVSRFLNDVDQTSGGEALAARRLTDYLARLFSGELPRAST
ncbi:lysophospholipid acyltransferase family protein [Pseudoxanthomonas dokdonensis]|uniref:Acyltransferase n=1 Tax=Pseudoxanthomonas dokdonensis TaxID=344882 RepID=A0A0R0CZB5_9GAMM|nr:lysophospholipid acyltransferase family protein [Pseudoxanthomonas dokdonensis]KRG71217.1 acyltransferase [Pseudoxanthomonas dokdonensis]